MVQKYFGLPSMRMTVFLPWRNFLKGNRPSGIGPIQRPYQYFQMWDVLPFRLTVAPFTRMSAPLHLISLEGQTNSKELKKIYIIIFCSQTFQYKFWRISIKTIDNKTVQKTLMKVDVLRTLIQEMRYFRRYYTQIMHNKT